MLMVLWQQRYILQQDGMPLYFSFIIFLCRNLTSPSYNNRDIDRFCDIIMVLLKNQCKVAFLQWNSNFLHDHKDMLKKQTYCALYFAILLSATNQNILVKPFYYSFIWNNLHKLSYKSKLVIQHILYQSFVLNELFFRKQSSNRKKCHLLELEFKSYDKISVFGNQFIQIVKYRLKIIRGKIGKNSAIYKSIKAKTMKYYHKDK